MTEEEIVKKAFEYRKELVPYTELGYPEVAIPVYATLDIDRAFVAGAKENGVVWHDLRKDPKDLPKDKKFKITDKGNIGFYDSYWEKWYYWNSNEMVFPPIAWCEIPSFKGGEE